MADQFTSSDLEDIDRLWRACPTDHVWAGWASPGNPPDYVWIFRKRANWRKFSLRKADNAYFLLDEKDRKVASGKTLESLLKHVEAIPGLNDPLS